MDHERATELLARERSRLQRELAALTRQSADEDPERAEPGERDSELLYEGQLDEARREQLEDELEAVRRAEDRLAAGTYGLSVQSGEPIPDARLEAMPTAERTVEEEARYRGS
jgi:DnaK suppressor protein